MSEQKAYTMGKDMIRILTAMNSLSAKWIIVKIQIYLNCLRLRTVSKNAGKKTASTSESICI